MNDLLEVINEQINDAVKQCGNLIDEAETWLIQDAILLGELLNPEGDIFDYTIQKGIYTYKDSKGNLFFVRFSYEPVKVPFFIMKTGWFENNDTTKPKYEPSLPDDVSAYDSNKRTNTVAKIYRDEIIPLFLGQKLSNTIVIEPLSPSRYQFSIRMIKKFTPKEFTIKEEFPKKIIITKP